ncbi:hypothetical protein OY671_012801, partial [Metschnikowia pulcherrima]
RQAGEGEAGQARAAPDRAPCPARSASRPQERADHHHADSRGARAADGHGARALYAADAAPAGQRWWRRAGGDRRRPDRRLRRRLLWGLLRRRRWRRQRGRLVHQHRIVVHVGRVHLHFGWLHLHLGRVHVFDVGWRLDLHRRRLHL